MFNAVKVLEWIYWKKKHNINRRKMLNKNHTHGLWHGLFIQASLSIVYGRRRAENLFRDFPYFQNTKLLFIFVIRKPELFLVELWPSEPAFSHNELCSLNNFLPKNWSLVIFVLELSWTFPLNFLICCWWNYTVIGLGLCRVLH